MGFIKHLLGIRGVGRVTTSFREDGNHRVTVERDSATSPSLDAAAHAAILFLYYAAKALHAVGSGPDADELRQDIALCALALRANTFAPVTSFIDKPGECIGRLETGRSGWISINTSFKVPFAETNKYVRLSAVGTKSRGGESADRRASYPTRRRCRSDGAVLPDGGGSVVL